jgi:hypothetical protein
MGMLVQLLHKIIFQFQLVLCFKQVFSGFHGYINYVTRLYKKNIEVLSKKTDQCDSTCKEILILTNIQVIFLIKTQVKLALVNLNIT